MSAKTWTFDQLLRQRAADVDQTPLIAFTKTRHGVTNYEPIAGAALNSFVDGAAKVLRENGFPSVKGDTVIGICAPTDLDYLITMFGFIRLGYIPFLISPRLAPVTVKKLLENQNSRTLFYAPDHQSLRIDDPSLAELSLWPLLARAEYDSPSHQHKPDIRQLDNGIGDPSLHRSRCIMLHSSGSTGLPRPIDMENHRLMLSAAYAQDATSFITSPVSHAFGLMKLTEALHKRRTIYWVNGYVPQTPDNLAAALTAADPEIVFIVPYTLGLLAESPGAVETLRKCRFVSSGGSAVPDRLGDMLTDAGVHLGLSFGSTETGLTLSSVYRPREDKAWNYLRALPHVLPYTLFRLVGDGKYEQIILDGHKGKTLSNSDDPPNSWHTGDLFVPHATIPNAWKFIGREDDRITFLNGEKLLPLDIEGRIRPHPLVKEAVVFGENRLVPGLLLFKSTGTGHLTEDEFLDGVWPTIQQANSESEGFSQISREMVVLVGEEVDCPSTDKSSIKRGQIYRDFATVIDAVYDNVGRDELLQLTVVELEDWIMRTCVALGYDVPDVGANFFSAGFDSFRAIQLRRLILRHLDLGGREEQCTSMIVFETGNATKLAEKLFSIRTGTAENVVDTTPLAVVGRMEEMIVKHSQFIQISPEIVEIYEPSLDTGKVVILTGATGFLGAHLLAALVASDIVNKIYCFIRTGQDGTASATTRLETSLREKEFDFSLDKVVPLSTNLEQPDFDLDAHTLATLHNNVSHVIHCAWTVNFVISLSAFEPQVAGLHNLINLARQTKKHSRLLFCSSVGVAQSVATQQSSNTIVPSAPIQNFTDVAPTGYAQSKLVGERLVEAAATARPGTMATLRIGQIVPGHTRGTRLWNPSEAMPLMIRSARSSSAGALPVLGPGRDACSWLHADTLADAIVDIMLSEEQQLVYNLVNPRTFSWKRELLPALKEAGLEFDVVSRAEWLRRLEASSDDAVVNPSRKLLEFWKAQGEGRGTLTFDVAVALAQSPALRAASSAANPDFLGQITRAWEKSENSRLA